MLSPSLPGCVPGLVSSGVLVWVVPGGVSGWPGFVGVVVGVVAGVLSVLPPLFPKMLARMPSLFPSNSGLDAMV